MNSGRVVKPQCRVQNCRGPFWEVRFTNLCLACPPIFLATETETHPYPLGLLQPHLALGLNQYYITKILKESSQPCVGWQNWPWVWILMEKAVAPHPSTLAWKIPWTEEPDRLQSMGLLRVGHNWATSLSCTGKGNGNPLQCSCLENPRDGGAWWAAVYEVAQSRTRLKRLGSGSSTLIQRTNNNDMFLYSSNC